MQNFYAQVKLKEINVKITFDNYFNSKNSNPSVTRFEFTLVAYILQNNERDFYAQ